MDRKRVLEALDVLNAELAGTDDVDEDARTALARVTEDIRQHLAEREAAGVDDDDAASALNQLTGAINQLAAALANLGI
jgi:hypothetical protein